MSRQFDNGENLRVERIGEFGKSESCEVENIGVEKSEKLRELEI